MTALVRFVLPWGEVGVGVQREDGVATVLARGPLALAQLLRPPLAEARARLAGIAIFCIGPITAATAGEEGLTVHAVAREDTVDGVVEALAEWFAQPLTHG